MFSWFRSLFGSGPVCKTTNCYNTPKYHGYCHNCWSSNADWMIKPRVYHDS